MTIASVSQDMDGCEQGQTIMQRGDGGAGHCLNLLRSQLRAGAFSAVQCFK